VNNHDKRTRTRSMIIDLLNEYQKLDFLRPLDFQFAKFIHELEITESTSEQADRVAKYAALVSHYLGRGHGCVSLDHLSERTFPKDAMHKNSTQPVVVLIRYSSEWVTFQKEQYQ